MIKNGLAQLAKLIALSLMVQLFCGTVSANSNSEQLAQNSKQDYVIPRIDQQPVIDGELDDSAWQNATIVELNFETSPGENTPAPVKTTARIFEDGETIFISFQALDHEPEKIRNYLLDRDEVWGADMVGLKFDTFGESRKAFQFFVTARGIQADSIQEDFRDDDPNWNAIWQSAAKLHSKGYSVEMAIPLKALRFPATGKKQRWGVEFLRFYPRASFHRIANTPVKRSISCKICQFRKLVGLKDITPSNNLQLTPTLVSSSQQQRDILATNEWSDTESDTSAGLDVRWGITDGTYLSATFNPDFSQVEANSAQFDINNAFSIFVDEKRPFFLDGSDYFNTSNRLVHTKNITAPDYGIKLTGQSDGHSYGAIVTDDQNTSYLVPSSQTSDLVLLEGVSSNNQILRYQNDFGNKNTIGLLTTNKDSDVRTNRVLSVDGKQWLTQNQSLSYQIMQSTSKDFDDGGSHSISDMAYSLRYEYEDRDWKAVVHLRDFGEDFRADLGFIRKVDFISNTAFARRTWFPTQNSSWWNKIAVIAFYNQTDDQTGQELQQEASFKFDIEGTYQTKLRLESGVKRRLWETQYFDETFQIFRFEVEPVAGLKLNVRLRQGDTIDFVNSQLGNSRRLSPNLKWQVNDHFLFESEYSKLDFDVEEESLFDATITNLKLTYLFDEKSSLRYTMQSSSVDRNVSQYNFFVTVDTDDDEDESSKNVASQLLYTYRVNPQTLFFAGYSSQGFKNQDIRNIRDTGRTLFMKFSYAWQI
jgi:hypothetical protein